MLTLLLSLVLGIVDKREDHLAKLRAALSVATYPIQYGVNVPVLMGHWITENWDSRAHLLKENRRLRKQNFLLRSRSQRFAALQAENMRLREFLGSSLRTEERTVVAELLAVTTDPETRRIVLNKGSQHGVFAGQPIVDPDGVIGQIIHVGPFSSTAMLISDAASALPAQINRSGLRTIVEGMGNAGTLRLTYVPNTADVREGDLIVSSGMGGRFPAGYPVGKVVQVDSDLGTPFAKIIVAPEANLTRSREVLLVWPQNDDPEADQISQITVIR